MSSQSPGERAVSQCEIDDVFLYEAACRGDRNVNQAQAVFEAICQYRFVIEQNGLGMKRIPVDETLPPIFVARYFITGEMRVLAPGVTAEEGKEVSEAEVLARIKLTFGIDYRCPEAFLADREGLAAFGKNAAWHVYPFWREAVHEYVGRMRLPRLIVPMMKPGDFKFNQLIGIKDQSTEQPVVSANG